MGDSSAEHGEGDVFDWTVLKAIQDANAASMSAMEEYLLLAAGPEALGDAEQTCRLIERSIDHHERIIEHLELAAGRLEAEAQVEAQTNAD